MEKFIKYTWMVLVAIGSVSLVVNLPYEEWQNAYFEEINKIQTAPQARIYATYRYIEAIENGKEDISKGILYSPPKKYYRPINRSKIYKVTRSYSKISSESKSDNKYQKPLYVRDRNNPNILHPVH